LEITRSIIDKFRVASLVVSPAALPGDILDFEFTLIHDNIEGKILGRATITRSKDVVSTSIPVNMTMSESARKAASNIMKRICRQMTKEWG
jgi:hypothetical protein